MQEDLILTWWGQILHQTSLEIWLHASIYTCNITTLETNIIHFLFAACTRGKDSMFLLVLPLILCVEMLSSWMQEVHVSILEVWVKSLPMGIQAHVLPLSLIPTCWEQTSHALAFQESAPSHYPNLSMLLAISRIIASLYQQWEVYIGFKALLIQKQWEVIAHDIC